MVAVGVDDIASAELSSHAGNRRTAAVSGAVVALVYLLLACAVYWPVSPFDRNRIVGCACGDAVQQVWFLRWAPFAVAHAGNPLFSSYLNAPQGVNLGVNTSMPLLGLLGWPVTAISNSVAAYNVLLRLGLALSAMSMYWVLRVYARSRAASFVGGLLFGFSPYMLAEGQLHVFLTFLPLLPLLIPLIDRWVVRADRNPYGCGAVIGLVFGLELLISAEMAAVFALFAVVAVLPLAVRHRDVVRTRIPRLARGATTAVPTTLLIGGIVPWMLIAGPQRPTSPPHSVADLDSYHGDLLSLVVPSRPQLLRPALLHQTADQFVRGVAHENGFYLGLPLLAVVVAGVIALRRQPLIQSMAALGVIGFVLGLGTRLTVANHVTSIPLPFALITHIPLLQEVGPTRFALAIQLAAAVILASMFDRFAAHTVARRRRAVVLVGAAALALLPLLPAGFVRSVPTRAPAYFSSSAVSEIPDGSTVLTYPFSYYSSNISMLWQTDSGMRFRMPGGEIYVPSASGRSTNYPRAALPAGLWSVLVRGGPERVRPGQWRAPSATVRAALVKDLQLYVAGRSINGLIEDSSGAQGRWVAALTASAFGPASSRHGDLRIWTAPTVDPGH